MQSKQDIIRTLALEPHPEGGYFRRTYKNDDGPITQNGQNRGHATAIYYLHDGGTFSRWHRTDGDELWFWHAGAPLMLEIKEAGDVVTTKRLGCNFSNNEHPQHLVPKNQWQRAKSEGEWTLVSCSVSPGFLFDTFEMDDS